MKITGINLIDDVARSLRNCLHDLGLVDDDTSRQDEHAIYLDLADDLLDELSFYNLVLVHCIQS